MPSWAMDARLTMDEYLAARDPSAADDQQAVEAMLGRSSTGYLYQNNGYTTSMTDMYVVPNGYQYEWGSPGLNKYTEYVKNPNVRYDAASNSFAENMDPLTRVGYNVPGNEFGGGGHITDEQARAAARTWLDVGPDWSEQDVKDYIANTPGFYDKYQGINLHPQGYQPFEGITYSQDFPTGERYSWPTKEVSGGIFGSSFMDPAEMSEWVEPINKYVGPLVLPTVMAIGGGLVGGGLAGAALAGTALAGTTAAGAITGAAQGLGASTFNTINQVDQGNTGGAILGALGSAATGGIAGAAGAVGSGAVGTMGQDAINTLAGDAFAAPVLTVDPSLSLNTGLITPDITSGFANYMGSTGADLASIYNTPSFTADPTLANNVTLPSLTPDAIAAPTYSNALTPTPEFQVNPALAPDAPAFSVNPSLDAFSNTLPELDPNYQSTAARDQIVNDTMSKFAKGLMSGNNSNAALPTFQTNFTPLSSQAFGNTGNSWGIGKSGQAGLQNSTFKDAPFKGSYLMNGQDDQNLTSYLADYLPLNASKKMKDFSSFVA